MTLHWYRGLAKQFIAETNAARDAGLISGPAALAVIWTIKLALDSERAAETSSVPPVRSVPWEGGGSLSAQRTRKL